MAEKNYPVIQRKGSMTSLQKSERLISYQNQLMTKPFINLVN